MRSKVERDFYTAFPFREWAVVKRIKQMTDDNICGELCSLRFTWLKSKKEASDEQVFLYETLAGLIDVAWVLANAPLAALHIEKVPGKNNLFALAMFENEVAACMYLGYEDNLLHHYMEVRHRKRNLKGLFCYTSRIGPA